MAPVTRPVRSFDLFDTLLGRLHYHPHSIYDRVEDLYPFPGFSFFRAIAEYKSDRTLAGIYREFQKLTDISDDEVAKLMQFELETEKTHIFPILENVRQVQEGDLIVSDTYYSLEQIQILLAQLPLPKDVQVYASPNGKGSGAAWAFLQTRHCIETHLGDSLHADVMMAKLHQIDGIHYTNGQLSADEQSLFDMGQRELSFLCRALRLSNPHEPQSAPWLLWNDQCRLNIPLLIHASLFVNDLCQKFNKRKVLFTSRDGCLWIHLFRQLFPQYESVYFHSSRHAYMQPSPSYIEYVRSVYSEDALIVDVQGKGASCEQFFKKHLQTEPAYLAIVNCGPLHHGILRMETGCEQIEMLNYDTCGTLYDVQGGEAKRRPVEYPVEYVEPMHACMQKCLELLPFYRIEAFDVAVIERAVESMRAGIALNRYLLHAYWHSESYHEFIKSIQQVKNCLVTCFKSL